jgi:hypothetical protein
MGTLLFSSSFSLIEFSVKSIFGSLDTVGSLLPGFATMDVVVGSQVAETGCATPTKPGHHQFTVAIQPMSPLEPSVVSPSLSFVARWVCHTSGGPPRARCSSSTMVCRTNKQPCHRHVPKCLMVAPYRSIQVHVRATRLVFMPLAFLFLFLGHHGREEDKGGRQGYGYTLLLSFFLCPINNRGFVSLLIRWRTMLSLWCPLGCNTKACDQAIIIGAQKSLGIPSHCAGLIMIYPSLNFQVT